MNLIINYYQNNYILIVIYCIIILLLRKKYEKKYNKNKRDDDDIDDEENEITNSEEETISINLLTDNWKNAIIFLNDIEKDKRYKKYIYLILDFLQIYVQFYNLLGDFLQLERIYTMQYMLQIHQHQLVLKCQVYL